MKTNPGATLLKPAKPPDSNYESPALTAELQARMRATRRTSNTQCPTSNFHRYERASHDPFTYDFVIAVWIAKRTESARALQHNTTGNKNIRIRQWNSFKRVMRPISTFRCALR